MLAPEESVAVRDPEWFVVGTLAEQVCPPTVQVRVVPPHEVAQLPALVADHVPLLHEKLREPVLGPAESVAVRGWPCDALETPALQVWLFCVHVPSAPRLAAGHPSLHVSLL